MSFTVLYFARSRELTRISSETIELEQVRAHQHRANESQGESQNESETKPSQKNGMRDKIHLTALLPFLLDRHADLRHLPLESLVLAHNHEMVPIDDETIELKAGDEVAFIQPISGG